MNVKELIAELQRLDPHLEVYARVDDENTAEFFSVGGAHVVRASLTRDAKDKPQIDFEQGQSEQKMAFVSLLVNF